MTHTCPLSPTERSTPIEQTPTFPTRGCGFRVTFFGAMKDHPGDPRMPFPVEITDTVNDMPVVTVLSSQDAILLARDLRHAARHAMEVVHDTR